MVGNRLVFHILSAEGDLKDIFAIDTEYTPKFQDEDRNKESLYIPYNTILHF